MIRIANAILDQLEKTGAQGKVERVSPGITQHASLGAKATPQAP